MSLRRALAELVKAAPLVDTHEHLLEERTRLSPPGPETRWEAARDFSVLFSHYAFDDLVVAGMPEDDLRALRDAAVMPRDKWTCMAPYYARARHTGYMQNVRASLRLLYGVDDLRADNVELVSERVAALIRPGYYRRVLKDVAHVHHCQVNSLEAHIFQESEYPDLLCQDISFVGLATEPRIRVVSELTGIDIGGLEDWHRAIDWCFTAYGPRAIAIKNQSAYERKLDYVDVPAAVAAPLFARLLREPAGLAPAERKAIQDHLFHYCVRRAAGYRLPVKLHTGYYVGYNRMPLHRLRENAGDLCDLLRLHPQTPFVIMHIAYPYQDEAIALAKHYANAYVDLCWAWIINPAASVRFVKEFLMAAPANKLLTFGGDYMPVELVPGHAEMARRGLAQALSELIEEGWLPESEAPALVARLTSGNALELFDYERTQRQSPPRP
ncbi:MAG: amidohydrolase [Lentisphaerae bacterium]|nr:amidohydrolase [Lentisphaerota bacterium]